MDAADRVPAPPGWSGRRVGRFVAIGAAVGALLGLVVFLVKVAVADDFAYGENWLWVIAVAVGALGGAVLGLLFAGLGHADADADAGEHPRAAH